MPKNLLIIGGSGAIGCEVTSIAYKAGFSIYIIGLERDNSDQFSHFIKCDRKNTSELEQELLKLKSDNVYFDYVVDLIVFTSDCCDVLYELTKYSQPHYVVLSTALNTCTNPINKRYIASKREVERYWIQLPYYKWTILKPYHIIGKRTGIGSTRPFNRDPHLINVIKEENKLFLYCNPSTKFSIINPIDIANIIIKMFDVKATFGELFYISSDEVVTHEKYFNIVADILGEEIEVVDIGIENSIEANFWDFTLTEQVFDGRKIANILNYTTFESLFNSIGSAIKFPSTISKGSLQERISYWKNVY